MATTPTRKTRVSAPRSASPDSPTPTRRKSTRTAASTPASPATPAAAREAASAATTASPRLRRAQPDTDATTPADGAAPVRKLRARGPAALSSDGSSPVRRRTRTLTTPADTAAPAKKPRSKAAAVELPETPKRHRAKVGEAILGEDTGKKPRARKAASKPTTPTPAEQVEQLKQTVLGALEDLKARELLVLDTRPLTSMFDWRIIVTGTSNRHLSSMAEEVAKRAKAIGMPPIYISGDRESDWVLVDLGDIVVDLMSEQSRAHYALEKLWSVPAAPPAA